MVSFITMINFGIMTETAQCLLSCLIVMVYSIRTVYGDSEFTYGGSKWPRTPHGNGQGNGSGPALWNGISSPLFDILREQNFGVHLMAPISNQILDSDLLTMQTSYKEQNEGKPSRTFLINLKRCLSYGKRFYGSLEEH